MKCPRCQHENPTGMKFCGECAAPLASICPSCGAANPPENRFCGQCAAPLRTTPTAWFAAPDSYTPKHLAEKILTSKASLEGERKQVTVLFADLKGSMELLADRDPEEARKLLDPVLALMMDAVHRYEGTVNQVMGDGIMALFGAPLAHEDHAVRACYAALRMQELAKRYAEGARRAHGVNVQIRVGLNSGEVVVRSIGSDLHMDYTAVGQTTHLAARMEQLATPGSILVTADTLRFAEGFVQIEPLGPMPVKGLAGPVEVYEVTGAGPVRTRLQASAARGLTRFVGRESEVEQLRAALDQARQGQGQVVAVVGEPGVGKSRLFHEFLHSHRTRGWLVLEAASVSYGKATAYLPLLDLLRGYFRIEPRDDTRAVREKVAGKLLMLDRILEDAVPAVLALLDALPEDSPFQKLDPAQRRPRTLAGLKRLVLRESQVQPLLLVFEDLHWIDSETQAFLDGLVESLPAAAVLLLVNYRPEYRPPWVAKTYYRQLRIDPLASANAGELLRTLLGDEAGLDPLKRILIERTEGNPFFLEECIRSLVETGALAGERGPYRSTRAISSVLVPASVQAILAARLDRLAVEDKQLLQTAAVIGKDVPFALLEAVAGADGEALSRGLATLQAAEFLYETRLFPDLEYTFKHALTHEVAYGSLLAERRRELHGRIALALEHLHASRLVEHVDQLAHHAYRAQQWDKAVEYLGQAAARAGLRFANRAAAGLFEQALEALAQLPETSQRRTLDIDLRFQLRGVLVPLGAFDQIAEVLRVAEAEAAALGDERRAGQAAAYLSESLRHAGEIDRSTEIGERGLAIAVRLDDRALEREASFHLAMVRLFAGSHRPAARLFRRSIELEVRGADDSGLLAVRVAVRGWLAWAHAELGEFDAAVAVGAEALAIAQSTDRPLSLAAACTCLGGLYLTKGDIETAASILERGLETSRAHGVALLHATLAAGLGYARAAAGRPDETDRLLEEAAAASGSPAFSNALMSPWLAEAYLLTGQVERAAEAAASALDLASRRKARGHEARLWYLLGEIAGRRDPSDLATAERHYEAARARAVELGMRPLVAHCHRGLGKLYARASKRQQAQAHFTTATTMYREMDMQFWLKQAEADMSGSA